MNRNSNSTSNEQTPQLLNVGCGQSYHAAWTNLDLASNDPAVICHDVTRGLPFEESTFQAVYHSHVLEHLKPVQGHRLIDECFRVLQPGGILRIAVPNLERIAKLYLETHQQAWSGDADSAVNYDWMKLELLDQLVRAQSGGCMGPYMASREITNSDFVKSRVGDELSRCQPATPSDLRKPTITERVAMSTLEFRHRMARRLVRWALGRRAQTAFDEGMFRSQGEIHRWMYDRYSLRELCQNAGFEDFRVCNADESLIDAYSAFELDALNGDVRKPDSIFVECQKPRLAVARKNAA